MANIRPPDGFTLVELMIVLFVIGLMTGVVLLTLPGDERVVVSDAERFAVRTAAARDMAIVRSRSIVVRISRDGYSFEQRAEGRWIALTDQSMKPRDWSAGVVATVPGVARSTLIQFDSTGMPSAPIDLALSRGDERIHVRLSGTGEVGLVTR